MFLGHYAVGLAAKPLTPRLSLGALFLAVQLPLLNGRINYAISAR
jgi:hypothetical protein